MIITTIIRNKIEFSPIAENMTWSHPSF